MRTILIALVAIAAFLACGPGPAHAASNEPMSFVLIHPGQPGTTEGAQPIIDELASYLMQKTGLEMTGKYYNELSEAWEAAQAGPSWGIVSMGFYVQFGATLGLTPMASTRPGGFQKDQWYILAPLSGPQHWDELSGRVLGTMLNENRAAACILFGQDPKDLDFSLEGTNQPLRAVRAASKDKIAAAVVDRLQYEGLKSLPLFNQVRKIMVTDPLPASPVVWFGQPDPEIVRIITEALIAMEEDPDAVSLLELLQTDGFGPADTALETLSKECPR